MNNANVFIEITNEKIYNRIEEINKENMIVHNEIIKRLDIANGKVKLTKWIATTALAVALILLGFFVEHVAK